MNNNCSFYATKSDHLNVLKRLEFAVPLKYVRFGQITKLPPESFNSALQIPNLGKASRPDGPACEKFLICDPQTPIRPRQLKKLTTDDLKQSFIIKDKETLKAVVGLNRFAIDQLINPDTITFSPGGIWNDDLLIQGAISTASRSRVSRALMKLFQNALKENFVKVNTVYVGPEALVLLKNGKRLTISAQSPPEFDLTIQQ